MKISNALNTGHVIVQGVEYEFVSRHNLLSDRYLDLERGNSRDKGK